MGKLLLSSLIGLCLLGACAEEKMKEQPIRGQGFIPTQPRAGTSSSPAPGAAGTFGNNPNGLMPIASTTGGPLGSGGNGAIPGESCGDAVINNPRVTPVVWLVVDGSGSMAEDFGGRPRWDALREALMDPNGGVVPTLDKLVKWGMVMYDGPLAGGIPLTLPDGGPATGMPPTDECPRLAVVEPALNNFANLDPMWPVLAPGGSTPTHKALAQVASHLPATAPAPDVVVDPVYVVLATDGAPNDFCAMGGGGFFGGGGGGNQQVAQEVITTTTQIAAAGVPVYVVSLANNDPNLTAHLQQVAQAGGTMKPPFTPMNKGELVQTFRDIIGPDVFCDVPVRGFGIMESVACMGTVKLNGEPLECGDNGWRLKDANTIEITGTACERFQKENDATITANFPCEVIIPT